MRLPYVDAHLRNGVQSGTAVTARAARTQARRVRTYGALSIRLQSSHTYTHRHLSRNSTLTTAAPGCPEALMSLASSEPLLARTATCARQKQGARHRRVCRCILYVCIAVCGSRGGSKARITMSRRGPPLRAPRAHSSLRLRSAHASARALHCFCRRRCWGGPRARLRTCLAGKASLWPSPRAPRTRLSPCGAAATQAPCVCL